jgi:16S rRNA (cytosine967-C5)-methyltransferase
VVDLCAAPGTKTARLAEKVRPGGRVIAWDPDPRRRQRIAENVARLGLGETVQLADDPTALPVADAVLADVPCSNTGVLGRRVEVRRRLAADTAAHMAATQRGILARALSLARPGGSVVYSTCSIEAEENGGVVGAVLADPASPRCELAASRVTLPAAGRCDGGFHAVLRVGGG